MESKTLAISCSLVSITILVLAPVLIASDPDPLQDFCVADLDSDVTVNGFPCQPSSSAGNDIFFSSRLTKASNTSNPNGSNVTVSDVTAFPGVNTLGVSMNRVDFAPGGTNPPHIHPRATEIGLVTRGELLVGIISTSNIYYSKVLRAGEIFVIPRGLLHFQFNVGKTEATQFVSFNSQRPGIVFAPLTLFGSTPPIPTPVLAKAYRVDGDIIDLIKSKFVGDGGEGTISDLQEDFSDMFA